MVELRLKNGARMNAVNRMRVAGFADAVDTANGRDLPEQPHPQQVSAWCEGASTRW
jgi:hypothetical protein